MKTTIRVFHRVLLLSVLVATIGLVRSMSAQDRQQAGEIIAITSPAYVRKDLRTAPKRLDPKHNVKRPIYVGERLGCGPGGAITYKEWNKSKKVSGGKTGIRWVVISAASQPEDNEEPGRQADVHFKAVHVTANGADYFQILADIGDGDVIPIFEVRNATKDISMEKRAEIIVARMTELQRSNPFWLNRLKTERQNGQEVVTVDDNTHVRYVVATADVSSVRPMGTQNTVALASLMRNMIRQAFTVAEQTGSARAAALHNNITPQTLALDGDRLLESDPAAAKKKYLRSLRMKRDYVYVQLQLARIYINEGDEAGAREMLAQAQKQSDLTQDERAEITRLVQELQ